MCLSLLNTWQGEPWSGVQSLSSILQSIQTAVLTEEPLRNEPAYSSMAVHADIPTYNRLVFHASLDTAILGQLGSPPPYLVALYEPVKKKAVEARDSLVTKARALAAEWDGKTETNGFYQMGIKYHFAELADRLTSALA